MSRATWASSWTATGDGARRHGLPTAGHGHQVGFAKIDELLNWCEDFGIATVTLWTLSDDNIAHRTAGNSPTSTRCDDDIVGKLAAEARWRLHPIGRTDLLPARLAGTLRAAHESPRSCQGMLVNLALGYGGRSDLLSVIRALVHEARTGSPGEVTHERLPPYYGHVRTRR